METQMDNFKKFDKRLIDRKFRSGEITEKDYKKFLDSLEECKEYSEINENEILKTAGIKRKKENEDE
jgi:hypothetical protein